MSYPKFSNQLRAHSLLHETNPTRRGRIHPFATAVLVLAPNLPNCPKLKEATSLISWSHLHNISIYPAWIMTRIREENGKNPVKRKVKNQAKLNRINLALARLKSKNTKMMQRIPQRLHLGNVTAPWTESPCTATALSNPIAMPWLSMPVVLPEIRSVQ